MSAQHFLLRLTRYGPLVPARLQRIDHEPGVPDNYRDRWPATIEVVDIAGEVRPPEELTERFHWGPGHWKYASPITEDLYRFHMKHLRWAEQNAPEHPTLRPRRRVDPRQLPLPNFRRENQHVG